MTRERHSPHTVNPTSAHSGNPSCDPAVSASDTASAETESWNGPASRLLSRPRPGPLSPPPGAPPLPRRQSPRADPLRWAGPGARGGSRKARSNSAANSKRSRWGRACSAFGVGRHCSTAEGRDCHLQAGEQGTPGLVF